MKTHIERPSGWILPLSTTYAIPFLGMYLVWFIWTMATARIVDDGAGMAQPLVKASVFWVATLGNLAFGLWALLELRRTFDRKGTFRRSHLAGIGILLVLLLLAQWAMWKGSQPFPV